MAGSPPRAATIVAAVPLLIAALLAGPAAPTGTVTATVWTRNVSGWVIHRGSATTGLVPVVTSSIRQTNADLVAVNELCWDQYRAIQADLAASGWARTGNFSRFESQDDDICNGRPFGLAIFSRAPLGRASRHVLTVDPQDQGERRKLLCAPVAGRRLRFCTTHISPYALLDTQLHEVRLRVEAFAAAGDTVLIAGDFNSEPHHERLDAWYAATLDTARNRGNRGGFRELDDVDPDCPGHGEGTRVDTDGGPCRTGTKIDLIFAPQGRIVGPHRADSLPISTACGGPCSDHRIVHGRVTVTVAG
jgi:endonuclease/exonuclease/phosphatase family metal-dependent hydrolase